MTRIQRICNERRSPIDTSFSLVKWFSWLMMIDWMLSCTCGSYKKERLKFQDELDSERVDLYARLLTTILMTINDDIMILCESDLSFDDVEEWFNVDTFATCTLLLTAKWTIVSSYPQVERYCVSRHSDLCHCPSLFDLSLMSMLFRVVQVFSCFRRLLMYDLLDFLSASYRTENMCHVFRAIW